MGKNRIKTDRIIAFSAMSISLMTLIIFIYQTSMIREQNRLSVTPRLTFNSSEIANDSLITINFELRNNGLGPAIIDSIAIVFKGQRYEADYRSFFEETTPKLYQFVSIPRTVLTSPGEAILAGESLTMFTAATPKAHNAKLQESITSGDFNAFDVEVIYSSIYKEQWKIRLKSDTSIPQKIN